MAKTKSVADEKERKNRQYYIYDNNGNVGQEVEVDENAGGDDVKRESEDEFKKTDKSAENDAVGTVFELFDVRKDAARDAPRDEKRGGFAFAIIEEKGE